MFPDSRVGRPQDPRKDYVTVAGKALKDVRYILCILLALTGTVLQFVSVLDGIMFGHKGASVIVTVRDSPAAEPKNTGSGREWSFGLTGWCVEHDAQVRGADAQ